MCDVFSDVLCACVEAGARSPPRGKFENSCFSPKSNEDITSSVSGTTEERGRKGKARSIILHEVVDCSGVERIIPGQTSRVVV